MRLTIPEARARAGMWLKQRGLPPAAYAQMRAYREESKCRAFSAVLKIEELDAAHTLVDFLVHDDGTVTEIMDRSETVMAELRTLGIDVSKRPEMMRYDEALEFFVSAIRYCKDRPPWFIKLDLLTPPRWKARHDMLVEVSDLDGKGVLTIPLKVLPTRVMKKVHMRPISSQDACRMIAMVVNRHLSEEQVATEFFSRLGNIRQSFVKRSA